MKLFRCDHCRQFVYFENHRCVACGHALAFLPDAGLVASLDADSTRRDTYTTPARSAAGRRYRLCRNYVAQQICNWAIAAESSHDLCEACRLTQVIPALSVPGNQQAWYKMEVAKRRWVHDLRLIGLPVVSKLDDPVNGLSFQFLADDTAAPTVLTGHESGLITINLAEANDAERERRRHALGEPFRTLLGHFRHESGHYFWDQLVRDYPRRLRAFREVFGDEQANYAASLQTHYAVGARAGWPDWFISAYASAHPWEDWAETWAHYLHMRDALETAEACGARVLELGGRGFADDDDFGRMLARWDALVHMVNNVNRSLGHADAYPFILPEVVVGKLRHVHDLITAVSEHRPACV